MKKSKFIWTILEIAVASILILALISGTNPRKKSNWIYVSETEKFITYQPSGHFVATRSIDYLSPFSNNDAWLVISGWENFYYRIYLKDPSVQDSVSLKSYYFDKCHNPLLLFTFIPKYGTIVSIETAVSMKPMSFLAEEDPTVIGGTISMMANVSREEQEIITAYMKSSEQVVVSLINCNQKDISWRFKLKDSAVAYQKLQSIGE